MLNEEDRALELALHRDDERTEGLGLALRQTRRGLVEAEDLGVERQEPGQLDHPPRAGREVGDVMVPVGAQAEQVDEIADGGPVAPAPPRRPRQGERRREQPRLVLPFEGHQECLVTVNSGNRVADWNVRPSPNPAR